MKEFIIPCNNEAHSRALEAVVGPEKAQEVLKAYKAIDAAMVFGYERGCKETTEALKVSEDDKSEREAQDKFLFSQGHAEGYVEGWNAADLSGHGQSAYDHGYEAGSNDAPDYDDGYCAGVSDARLWPQFADEEVARLCSSDEFDETNVSDSGDETDEVFFNDASGLDLSDTF
jgi:hypothetical protein